ncbi:MAG: M23 family metallopeptidase [Chitinophagales bacterium]|nr:M23 family metallopeptidase [Chitinophagales bacterium]
MKKVKYYYNKQSLRYEKIEVSFSKRLLRAFGFLSSSFVFSIVIFAIVWRYIDSPKEREMRREIEQLRQNYEWNQKKLAQMSQVLAGLQKRDDNIYRVIFEAEPISESVRTAGTGGSSKYADLQSFDNSELMIETAKMIDKVGKQMYIQSKSYDEINRLIKKKEQMLASIPAIMPVANKNLTRVASGYGFRIHPIYKTRKMHYGMDFNAPIGTPIFATGDGVVKEANFDSRGFGNHVIVDHGFGYETVYGHMSRITVRPGQKVKRGDQLGLVGNTGTSTGPHVHYEVHKGGQPINPINFYYNDLSPDEYEKMLEISNSHNQSFD